MQSNVEATIYSLPQNELLYADQAETLAAECYLKMSRFFKIKKEERSNVQDMSQCKYFWFNITHLVTKLLKDFSQKLVSVRHLQS